MFVAPESLTSLNAEQLRELARDLIAKVARQDAQITHSDQQIGERDLQITLRDLQIASLDQTISSKDREILYRGTKIDQLTHEMAILKRLASLAAAANNSMLARPVCSTRASMPTSQPSSKNYKI